MSKTQIEWVALDWPAPPRVRAGYTTRRRGASLPPYAQGNLGDHVGDDVAHVAANRAALAEQIGVPLHWLRQVHGAICADAANSPLGCIADASFTRKTRLGCVVLTADCLPLLLAAQDGSVAAAVHAGWRGLAAGVIEAALAHMDTPGSRLMAWLGPAIGPTAYEVGAMVRDAFVTEDVAAAACFVSLAPPGKYLCDLYGLARLRLQRLGCTQIYGGDLCAHTDAERFYSHRREGVCGRFASAVWLED